MRSFAIVGHLARTEGDFILEDLPGSGGRMDLLCRCIQAALFLSHTLRRDTDCYLVFLGEPAPPKTICIRGSEVHSLNPDERSTAALLRKALALPVGTIYRSSTPGIYIRATGFSDLLLERGFALSDEGGEDIRKIQNLPAAFLLSDHLNLTKEEQMYIPPSTHKISVSPRSLHADHAIILIHNELDRREAGWT